MKKILIIDDDPEYKEVLTTLLEENNYSIITAQDGLQGIRRANKEKPDLIILDVMMTRITEGFETLRKLKKEKSTQDIPVILSTGIKDYHESINLKPGGAILPVKTVLEKPVDPEELLKAIEENLKK